MIIRKVKIKVFRAGNKDSFTHTTLAGPYKQFTAAGIEAMVAAYAKQIDEIAPDQYDMVQVGPGEFNFVHQP